MRSKLTVTFAVNKGISEIPCSELSLGSHSEAPDRTPLQVSLSPSDGCDIDRTTQRRVQTLKQRNENTSLAPDDSGHAHTPRQRRLLTDYSLRLGQSPYRKVRWMGLAVIELGRGEEGESSRVDRVVLELY